MQIRVTQGDAYPSELAIRIARGRLVSEGIVIRAQLLRPLNFPVEVVAIVEELASSLVHEHSVIDIPGKGIVVVANINGRRALTQGKSRAFDRQPWINHEEADARVHQQVRGVTRILIQLLHDGPTRAPV